LNVKQQIYQIVTGDLGPCHPWQLKIKCVIMPFS
jgi:hypothetical protein